MQERIAVDPHMHCGKPCVAGTSIPVFQVLELVHAGVSWADMLRNYDSDLQMADIQACLRYAMHVIASEDFPITAPACDASSARMSMR